MPLDVTFPDPLPRGDGEHTSTTSERLPRSDQFPLGDKFTLSHRAGERRAVRAAARLRLRGTGALGGFDECLRAARQFRPVVFLQQFRGDQR